jgi:hypothetical protein
MAPKDEEFNLIKKDLIAKIDKIDKFISGDATSNPPIKGIHERVTHLEDLEQYRLATRQNVISMATGSIAIAIGGVIIWCFNILKAGLINHK